ncbi:Hypothetical_protein [Hexamita inflata]|uniref:Hypothetical_protein n=1 Tax=Hexamita inflata TaxID=28002 RepID=A0AA86RJ68_9EUKA|nr:Hypothetical protein HINF_LOCUS63011 [Hexamita inflata]
MNYTIFVHAGLIISAGWLIKIAFSRLIVFESCQSGCLAYAHTSLIRTSNSSVSFWEEKRITRALRTAVCFLQTMISSQISTQLRYSPIWQISEGSKRLSCFTRFQTDFWNTFCLRLNSSSLNTLFQYDIHMHILPIKRPKLNKFSQNSHLSLQIK